jgi:hypothetical protein
MSTFGYERQTNPYVGDAAMARPDASATLDGKLPLVG